MPNKFQRMWYFSHNSIIILCVTLQFLCVRLILKSSTKVSIFHPSTIKTSVVLSWFGRSNSFWQETLFTIYVQEDSEVYIFKSMHTNIIHKVYLLRGNTSFKPFCIWRYPNLAFSTEKLYFIPKQIPFYLIYSFEV